MNKLAALALAAWMAVPAAAEEQKAPLPMITTKDLKARMGGKPAAQWDFVLIDARTRTEFEDAHIDGAILVMAEQTAKELPKAVSDKNKTLVFYCNGVKCTKSEKGARAAMAAGYKNVLEYNEGLPAWTSAGEKTAGTPLPQYDAPALSGKELQAALADEKTAPVLLDVRPQDEFAKSRIKGSLNVPLDEIKARIASIPDKTLVIVDHGGKQTLIAGRLLKSLGRESKRLGGGLLAWKEAGLPLEEPAAPKS